MLTTAAVSPPDEITLLAINTALPMQNGHICSSTCRVATHRERTASARFFAPAFIYPHPAVTPLRWSS